MFPRKEIIFLTFCIFALAQSLQICIVLGDCDPHASCAPGLISLYCVCNTGYVGDGATCSLVDCGTPPLPSHAVWTQTNTTTWNSTWTFDCGQGYQVSGNSTIQCQANGNWSIVGTCTAPSWNGSIRGDITGTYTNGCRISKIPQGYLSQCPNGLPTISFLTFYLSDHFYFSNNQFPYYYGGVKYPSPSNNTVISIWIQNVTNVWKKGAISSLVPVPRQIKFSKDHETCYYYPNSYPKKDGQRCEAGLNCLFRSPAPTPVGAQGICWYPNCNVSICDNGGTFMQDGYCHALSGGGNECVSYLPDGATGCGGYTNGIANYPACNPFTSFCIAGVCTYSDCLTGCEFGQACLLQGLTATCQGQGIPGIVDSITLDILGKIVPDLPLNGLITLQNSNATTSPRLRALASMPRTREGSSRRVRELFDLTPCTPGVPNGGCPANMQCVPPSCQSTVSNPCGPFPCP